MTTETDTQTSPQRSPWYTPTPGKFLIVVMVMQGVLFLSAHYRWFWFNERKGYTVLITVGATAIAILLLAGFVAVSRFFKGRFFRSRAQFSLATLLLMVPVMAIPCAWLARDVQRSRKRQEFLSSKAMFVAYDGQMPGSGKLPGVPEGLVALLGREFFGDVVTIQGLVAVDLNELKQFPKLRALTVHGDYITDEGLAHLKAFPDLFMLGLDNGKYTDAGLADLQKALPRCRMTLPPNRRIKE